MIPVRSASLSPQLTTFVGESPVVGGASPDGASSSRSQPPLGRVAAVPMFLLERGRFFAHMIELSACCSSLDAVGQKLICGLNGVQSIPTSLISRALEALSLACQRENDQGVAAVANSLSRYGGGAQGESLNLVLLYLRGVLLSSHSLGDELQVASIALRATQGWVRERHRLEAPLHSQLLEIREGRVRASEEVASRTADANEARRAFVALINGCSEVAVAFLAAELTQRWREQDTALFVAGLTQEGYTPGAGLRSDLESIIQIYQGQPFFDFAVDTGKFVLERLFDTRMSAALQNFRVKSADQTDAELKASHLRKCELALRVALLRFRETRSREECVGYENVVRDELLSLIDRRARPEHLRSETSAVLALTDHLLEVARSSASTFQKEGLFSRSWLIDQIEGLANGRHAGGTVKVWRALSGKLFGSEYDSALDKIRTSLWGYRLAYQDASRVRADEAALRNAVRMSPQGFPVDGLSGGGARVLLDSLKKTGPVNPAVDTKEFFSREQESYRRLHSELSVAPDPTDVAVQVRQTIAQRLSHCVVTGSPAERVIQIAEATALMRLLLDEFGAKATLDDVLSNFSPRVSGPTPLSGGAVPSLGADASAAAEFSKLRNTVKSTLDWYLTVVAAAAFWPQPPFGRIRHSRLFSLPPISTEGLGLAK